jgi:cell wall assembly regulator SMI1
MTRDRPDDRGVAPVDESWAVITGLVRHRCPDILAQVRPPATPEWLCRAEEAVGGPLPADLARWWQLADGMDGHASLIPQAHTPLSIEAALSSRSSWLKVSPGPGHHPSADAEGCANAPAGTPCEDTWLPQWLPIAADGGGTDLFVDLRPGPAHGCVGEYYSDGWEFDGPIWTSVAAMLADVAEAIRTDKPARGFRIWADEEGVDWDLDSWRWAQGGSAAIDPERLRQRYADLVGELRAGGFAAPSDDGWPAEMIAAHVKRNTELLIAVTDKIAATGPDFDRQMADAWSAWRMASGDRHRVVATRVDPFVRYDNGESMDPAVLNSYAAAGLPQLADDIEQLTQRLLDSARRLHGRRPLAYAHIVDGGIALEEEVVGWWGVLWALCLRQLPRRLRQLQGLRRVHDRGGDRQEPDDH